MRTFTIFAQFRVAKDFMEWPHLIFRSLPMAWINVGTTILQTARCNLKRRLECDLRIGSAYHLGSRNRPFNFSSKPYPVSSSVPEEASATSAVTSSAFVRHPFNLILAREQGDIGPAPKSRRLSYQATRWLVEGEPRFDGLQTFGNRSIGALNTDPQTFQESVQGSLWAVSRLHLENKFKCHRGCVNALSFNTTGNLIASGSDDLKVVVTNWITKEQVARYDTRHCMNIFHVKFVPETNDTQIVSCACDSEVRLAQLASDGSLVGATRLLVSHQRACHKLALPQGEPHIVLSAGADGQVFSIDLRESKAHNILWLPFSEFFSISSNPVKPYEFAVCGRSEAVIRVYDRRKMDPRDPSSGYVQCYGAQHLRPRNRNTISPMQNGTAACDGNHEAENAPRNGRDVGNDDEDTEDEEDAEDGIGEHEGDDDDDDDDGNNEGDDFFSSVSARIGRRVRAVLSRLRGRARIALRVQGNQQRGRGNLSNLSYGLEKSKFSATAAVYSNQGDAILASYNDEDIYLFDVKNPSGSYLHKYSGHRNMQTIVSATFFGPNSEYVVSGSDDGFFYIWDRESEGIVQWLHADADGAVNVIESHPSLPVLASAGLDFDFKIWTPLHPLAEPDDLSHLKYTFSRVPPDILRLRRSRLAQALFATNRSHGNRVTTGQSAVASHESVGCTIIDDAVSEGTSGLSTEQSAVNNCSLSTSSRITLVLEPTVNTSERQLVRKRRRCHSSTSDVPDAGNTTDSEAETYMEVHSDGENSNGLSPRARNSRQSRRSRRRRRFSPSNHGDLPQQNSGVPELTVTASKEVAEQVCSMPMIGPQMNCRVQPRLPQYLLPFNQRDLELRVAQNWVNRTCESRQIDGLDEADSRILSALETVAQLHARETHRDDDSADSADSHDTGGSTDDFGIMGSFLLIRRPNCPVERSEESLTTRDRPEQVTVHVNSDSDSWTSYSSSSSSSQSTETSQINEEDSAGSQKSSFSSSTSSTISSGSTETAVATRPSTPPAPASNDHEITPDQFNSCANVNPTVSDDDGDEAEAGVTTNIVS
ncbi:WD repeat-containing protein 42A [Fasciola gigantica]|uniref:WD repeat-containing protein 42A n=1 Tax=Fasciola gigantica TaxID=46835 RepID=A0A504YXZ7_FASGI|nr:WD repeat-containing protein 42A [Fasciola gigantica]